MRPLTLLAGVSAALARLRTQRKEGEPAHLFSYAGVSWRTDGPIGLPRTSTPTLPASSPRRCRRSPLLAASASSAACTPDRARSTSSLERSAWSPRRSRISCGCCAISASWLGGLAGAGRRDGRQVVYDLYDDHVGELLEQAISHVEHVRAGLARTAPARQLAEA